MMVPDVATGYQTRRRGGQQSAYLVGALSVFSVWLVAMIGVGVLLWVGSHWAVSHDVHAVEFENGVYIHGSDLQCEKTSIGTSCEMDLSGEVLSIQTQRFDQIPRSVGDCTATFAGAESECSQAYPTSSYWSHGVKITGGDIAEAVEKSQAGNQDWRIVFLGRSEGSVMQISALLGVAGWFVSLVLVPPLIRRFSPNHLPRIFSLNGSFSVRMSALTVYICVLAATLVVSAWVPMVLSLVFDYAD